MKYVPKPKAIEFKNGSFGVPQFVDYLIGSDAEFNSDGEGIRSAHRLQKALNDSEKLHYLPLEDSDHARVKKAAEKPSKGYPTPQAWMCYDYLQAIADAKDTIPEPPPAEEAPAAPETSAN